MTQHPFLALTDADREEMLATIGVASIDELFRDLPQAVRFGRELDLEPALSEQEVFAHVAALAEQNADAGSELSFLGAGIYDHYVPAVVDVVWQRGEFLILRLLDRVLVEARHHKQVPPQVLAGILLGVVANGLNLFGVSPFWQPVATGLILIVAVAFDGYSKRGALAST